jgi:hypothetical protein
MALNSYTNLKTSIVGWAKRTDSLSLLDDFIELAEVEMWKHLRIKELEARSTAVSSGRYLALPTDYMAIRRLRAIVGAESYDLEYRTPGAIDIISASGVPSSYTITTQFEFNRPASATIEAQYYKKPTSLSSSNATNEVLDNYPDVYLFGCLWALWKWGEDLAKSEHYYNMMMTAINGANMEDKKGRYGIARMVKKGSAP